MAPSWYTAAFNTSYIILHESPALYSFNAACYNLLQFLPIGHLCLLYTKKINLCNCPSQISLFIFFAYEDEMQASTLFLPVYYTHLDVYKRQLIIIRRRRRRRRRRNFKNFYKRILNCINLKSRNLGNRKLKNRLNFLFSFLP